MSKYDKTEIRSAISAEVATSEESVFTLSPAERNAISLVVIEQSSHEASILRSALNSLGFPAFQVLNDHQRGLDAIADQNPTHIIFCIEPTSIGPKEFLEALFKLHGPFVAMATGSKPSINDIFSLLGNGARGFITKPFSLDSLEKAISTATKLPPIPASVLKAKDRSGAFAAMVLGDLDRLTRAYRQSSSFESARCELPKLRARLQQSVEMAQSYCGESFMDSLVDATIELADGPATHLGRLRKRLLQLREE